jgi:hypothetical protein
VFVDPDLTPFEPPLRPLALPGLPLVFRNYIETIARSAYEDGETTFGRVRLPAINSSP